jgi:hypothetical protein
MRKFVRIPASLLVALGLSAPLALSACDGGDEPAEQAPAERGIESPPPPAEQPPVERGPESPPPAGNPPPEPREGGGTP